MEFDVKTRMAELEKLDRPGLCKLWQRQFGRPPPNYTSMGFMRKAIIWEEQSAVSGGIPPYLMRALRSAGNDRQPSGKVAQGLKPGALLIREWNGRSYQVEVTSDGFRFDGLEYRSLSAISKKITGTSWSGPRFFGLIKGRGKTE